MYVTNATTQYTDISFTKSGTFESVTNEMQDIIQFKKNAQTSKLCMCSSITQSNDVIGIVIYDPTMSEIPAPPPKEYEWVGLPLTFNYKDENDWKSSIQNLILYLNFLSPSVAYSAQISITNINNVTSCLTLWFLNSPNDSTLVNQLNKKLSQLTSD